MLTAYALDSKFNAQVNTARLNRFQIIDNFMKSVGIREG